MESSCHPSALLLLGGRGESCCRAVEGESLVSWVVSVSVVLLGLVVIVYQGWSLEGSLCFFGALLSVILGSRVLLFVVVSGTLGVILAWHGLWVSRLCVARAGDVAWPDSETPIPLYGSL